jgi:hypothetical protein
VLVAVDEAGQERRALTVVDDLSTLWRRLPSAYLKDPTVLIHHDLAVRVHIFAVEDEAGADDEHAQACSSQDR